MRVGIIALDNLKKTFANAVLGIQQLVERKLEVDIVILYDANKST